MNIAQWVQNIYTMACQKGWWDGYYRDQDLSVDQKLSKQMLMVGELSEASEEVRSGKPFFYWNTPTGIVTLNDVGHSYNLSVGDQLQKPEGEAVELADAVIRIFDYAGFNGWDMEKIIAAKVEYNATRLHRHGGKLA